MLQYKLYEAQDVGLEERIAVLEELKKRDYREKWAYELAYLCLLYTSSLPTAVESGWREAKRFYGWKNEGARTDKQDKMAGECLKKGSAAEWNHLVKVEEAHMSDDSGSFYSCACGEESRLLAYLDAVMERDIFCENTRCV